MNAHSRALEDSEPRGVERLSLWILLGLIALALLLKFRLDHAIDVHWDEFSYLAQVHAHERGELRRALMTFHVQLFGWLRQVPGNGIDQIIAARDAMFVLRLATTSCLFLIGRRFLGVTGALFAVFCSLSFSHVMKHGESFRFDPMLSFFFLLACCLLILRPGRLWAGIAAGVSLALAALVSLKLALLLPSIAVIFAVGWFSARQGAGEREVERTPQRAVAWQLLACVAGFVVAGSLLYASHAATLAPAAAPDLRFARDAADDYLVFERFFPNIIDLARSLRWDVGFWPLAVAGAALALHDLVRARGDRRRRAALVLALALPLSTLVFYRNAFAYFYVTIIPPASLLCGFVVARVASRLSARPLVASVLVVLLALPLAIQLVRFHRYNARDALARQRLLVDTVQSVFPEPVPYVDRCNMIVSYPAAGPFMMTWVMRSYRERGVPMMEERLRERQPVFLLANITSLNLARSWQSFEDEVHPQRFLREDFELLQRHFIRHWGPIWVAGKRFPELSEAPHDFEILIHGVYTLEASGPMLVDGELARPGSLVRLDPGPHQIRTTTGSGRAMLRYGEALHRPQHDQLGGTYFSGLGFRTSL